MPIRPDPPVKWVLRDRLLNELYKPVEEQRDEELKNLIHRNSFLNTNQDLKDFGVIQQAHLHPSFAFNGHFYSLADAGPPVRNRVHPDLVNEVRTFVDFYGNVFSFEQIKVQGYLDSMFSFSTSPGDWIRLLPDSLQSVLRGNIIATENQWAELHTAEECEAFIEKRRSGFELIRQRLATNLISI